MTLQHRKKGNKVTNLTKEEREFIYAIMNQVAVQGIGANQLKVDVMKKMGVEPEEEEKNP